MLIKIVLTVLFIWLQAQMAVDAEVLASRREILLLAISLQDMTNCISTLLCQFCVLCFVDL
jgi:hypothetical protein